MRKFIKFSIAALILTGLMVVTASAGVVSVNNGATNMELTVSLPIGANLPEEIQGLIGSGTAANPQIPALTYVTAQALVTGNIVNVTFIGAAFNGAPIDVCAVSGISPIHVSTATPVAGTNMYNFSALNAVPSGQTIYFRDSGGGDILTCNSSASSGAINFPIIITPTIVPGLVTVKISTLSSGGLTIDSGVANVAQISGSYTVPNLVNIGAFNHTIDYISSPYNGTKLLGNSFSQGSQLYAASSDSFGGGQFIGMGAPSVNVSYAPAGLTASLVVNLTDTASWQGVTKVYLANNNGGFNGTCSNDNTAGGNVIGVAPPSGTVTLNVPTTGFGFSGSNSVDYALCVVVNGTSTLTPRTISESAQLTVLNGWTAPSATPYLPVDTWGLNAYQTIIPWLMKSNAVPTNCLVSNNSGNSALMTLDVLGTDAGSITSLSGLSLGAINATTTELITFNASGVTTSDTNNSSPSLLTLIAANSRYVAKLTVGAGASMVTVTCSQTDPLTGGMRNLNSLKSNSPY